MSPMTKTFGCCARWMRLEPRRGEGLSFPDALCPEVPAVLGDVRQAALQVEVGVADCPVDGQAPQHADVAGERMGMSQVGDLSGAQ